jgi:RNA polymerase sigma factor (sigma-70 family)
MPNGNGYTSASNAIEQLLEQFEAMSDDIMRFAFKRCGHQPTSDDIRAAGSRMDVKLRENDCRILRMFEGRSSLRTFLQTIANRDIADFLEKERKKTGLDDVPAERFVQPPNQEEVMWLHERQHLLDEAKKELDAEERELYRLWYVERLSAKQIAQKLGCSAETVRQRKKRLFEKLRKRINKK